MPKLQLSALRNRFTEGQWRRRAARLERRRSRGVVASAPGPRPRLRWIDRVRFLGGVAGYRKVVKARLEQVYALAGRVQAGLAAMRARVSTDRCGHRFARKSASGRHFYTLPCGGRMRPANRARTIWACQLCGRTQSRGLLAS